MRYHYDLCNVGNEALYPMITRAQAVHLDDVCNAHIYLFEHPEAEGRYICSSHCFTILDLAKSLSQRYPEYNIPTKYVMKRKVERYIEGKYQRPVCLIGLATD